MFFYRLLYNVRGCIPGVSGILKMPHQPTLRKVNSGKRNCKYNFKHLPPVCLNHRRSQYFLMNLQFLHGFFKCSFGMVECLHYTLQKELTWKSSQVWHFWVDGFGQTSPIGRIGGICYIVPWRVLSEETSQLPLGHFPTTGFVSGFPDSNEGCHDPRPCEHTWITGNLCHLIYDFICFICDVFFSILFVIDFVVFKFFFTAYSSLPCNILKAKSKKMFAISKLAFKHIADRVSNKDSIALTHHQ